jgi:glutamate racemase
MLDNRSYIGIFDSGIGGLTVFQKLMEKLPRESLIYFGDTARFPYGNKSQQTIIDYSIDTTHFLIKKNIKLLVIACHTASALALQKLQQLFSIPIIGVIEAGAEQAVSVTRQKKIAVLGTKGTIQSGIYQQEIQKRLPAATVFPIACPLLAPLVEEQFFNHLATQLIIKEYLASLQSKEIDTVLLGCTHYPFLKHFIQQEMGPHVTLVDSASACADQVAHVLMKHNLASNSSQADYYYYVSDDPVIFRETVEQLFKRPFEKVELWRHCDKKNKKKLKRN